jgi:hypothetical protein
MVLDPETPKNSNTSDPRTSVNAHPFPPRRTLLRIAIGFVVLLLLCFAAVRIKQAVWPSGMRLMAEDNFDTTSETLGEVETLNGLVWKQFNGNFATSFGGALVTQNSTANVRKPHAILVPLSPVSRVTSRLDFVSGGSGIIFRFGDSLNFWSIQAEPAYSTWNIVKTEDGKPTFVGNSGLTEMRKSSTISVTLSGSEISVLINGKKLKTISDSTGAKNLGVGLLGSISATSTIWQQFSVFERD